MLTQRPRPLEGETKADNSKLNTRVRRVAHPLLYVIFIIAKSVLAQPCSARSKSATAE